MKIIVVINEQEFDVVQDGYIKTLVEKISRNINFKIVIIKNHTTNKVLEEN